MVVSCVLIGGTGNNFFQIATTLAYSLKHNIEAIFPTKIETPHYLNQKVFYSCHLKYSESEHKGFIVTYNEPHFHYSEIPYVYCDILILRGYFQSYLYFSDYREEILNAIALPVQVQNDAVFIHYRLGDYEMLGQYHPIISSTYLFNSIGYFMNRGFFNFKVFSDNIEIAKNTINSKLYNGANFEYSEGKTEIEDLSLMAACRHGIMSASSFSWWGAWLGANEDRIIFYPKKWFGPELSHHITTNICPPNWVAL